MYLPDNYSTVGLIAKQAKEVGIKAVLLGSDSWSDPGLVKVCGDAALQIADRGYVLETDKVVLEGLAQDLLHDDSVRRAYLGE